MIVYVSTPTDLSDKEYISKQKAALKDVLPQLAFVAEKLEMDPAISLIEDTYLIRASGPAYVIDEIASIIDWLMDCDAVVMAPGYETCNLCLFELVVAHLMQLPVLCAGITDRSEDPPPPGRLFDRTQSIDCYSTESNASAPAGKDAEHE